MITITRGLAVGAVLAGAAIGLAGPASADPTAGPYTATIIDPGASNKAGSVNWSLEPCGPDCFRLLGVQANPLYELRRQGNVWAGSSLSGSGNSATLDNDSLILTMLIPGEPNVVIGMTKNG
jgi:hypothetical protein